MLHLRIITPVDVLIETDAVLSLVAEDASGSFGLQPGHADLLTVLPPSVLRWSLADGSRQFCAVRAGILTMQDGNRIDVACRQGVPGGTLEALQADIAAARAELTDSDRRARAAQLRLHAQAVRHLVHYLLPGEGIADEFPGNHDRTDRPE